MNPDELWQSFALAVIEPGAPEIQKIEMRRAFYAGMWGMFCLVVEASELPESDAVQRMDLFHKQLKRFNEKLATGEA